ncbi:GNAT family N-acetyltransferase [Sphingomonas rubra]|uniref:Protein N-acetyltransferase, RimJ/RimL family n=1 Tax=Sphingomonas rubra TaxID=634430 RepID=A0A1I5TJZ6_9SPHN|nr:GNAT family N-acetyltransferase [Sphingomonas rubra]SFP83191.1 Protein N-acetyltransferase, RimJ/RimL family [Sphingomonas rubra]
MPPTLSTARLILTPSNATELDDFAALNADPAVVGPIGTGVQTREQSWHRLLRYVGHWQVLGYGNWTVRDTAGLFLGSVGLLDSRRDSVPSFEGEVEAGWAFMPAAHGRGYAMEACAAMLGWADAHGIARTLCMIGPDNAASLRLAGRLGYGGGAAGWYAEKAIVLLERAAAVERVT